MKKLLIGADVVMIGIFVLKFRVLPQQIPLLYSRPWGESQIVEVWYITLIPVLMHLCYFFNIFISKKYFHSEELFKKLFKAANIFLIIAFTGIFLKIILLVT